MKSGIHPTIDQKSCVNCTSKLGPAFGEYRSPILEVGIGTLLLGYDARSSQ